MDLQIVTLEITTLIIAFDHYNQLVSGLSSNHAGPSDEYDKIKTKSRDHLASFFGGAAFYNEDGCLKQLGDIKTIIKSQLADSKSKEIHDLVEKLEKDVKKMRKLYKAMKQ